MVSNSLLVVSVTCAALVLPPAEGNRAKTFESTGSFSSTALALWDTYVQETTDRYINAGPGIQSGCEPQMYKNQGDYQGTIMLIHGYTACNQQFELLVPKLTSKGFVVLAPLLPGHGAKSQQKEGTLLTPVLPGESAIEDFIDFLPTDQGDYAAFGDRMNSIMATAGGDTVVFGLSLGGAVASYMGHHHEYTRRFIAVPFIRTPGLVDIFMTSTKLTSVRRSWGVSCEYERVGGRAGICQFTADIANAARNFGVGHLESIKEASPLAETGATQIVFVEDDPAVSVDAVQELSTKLGVTSKSKHVCGFDAVVGHSFLSPYDNPNENKFWLDEFTEKVAEYLTHGTPLAQDGKIKKAPDFSEKVAEFLVHGTALDRDSETMEQESSDELFARVGDFLRNTPLSAKADDGEKMQKFFEEIKPKMTEYLDDVKKKKKMRRLSNPWPRCQQTCTAETCPFYWDVT